MLNHIDRTSKIKFITRNEKSPRRMAVLIEYSTVTDFMKHLLSIDAIQSGFHSTGNIYIGSCSFMTKLGLHRDPLKMHSFCLGLYFRN